MLRARETDTAHRHLHSREQRSAALEGLAGRYHTAVCTLRTIVAERVTPFVEPGFDEDRVRFADVRGERREAAF